MSESESVNWESLVESFNSSNGWIDEPEWDDLFLMTGIVISNFSPGQRTKFMNLAADQIVFMAKAGEQLSPGIAAALHYLVHSGTGDDMKALGAVIASAMEFGYTLSRHFIYDGERFIFPKTIGELE